MRALVGGVKCPITRALELFIAGLIAGILVIDQFMDGEEEILLMLRTRGKLPSHPEVQRIGKIFRAPVHHFLSPTNLLPIPIGNWKSYILVAEFPDGTRIVSEPQEVGPGQFHNGYIVGNELHKEIRAH